MPGNYKTLVTFPFDFDGAKSARIQMEPFVCVHCYGVSVKVILEMVAGNGENAYSYERVAYEDALTQENIRDGFMSAPFIEVMEGFYYNKTEAHVLVPVCALLLQIYFREILNAFHIHMEQYVSEIEYAQEVMGFQPKASTNVSNNKPNKSSYKKESSTTPFSNKGNDEAENKTTCKQIIKSLCQKSQKFKTRI